MASILLGAVVVRHVSVVNPGAARRAALDHTVVRLREGFGRRGPGSSSSVSEGRTSSVVRSSSVGAEQIGTAIEYMSRINARAQGETMTVGFNGQHGGIGLNEEFGTGSGFQTVECHLPAEKPGSCQQSLLLDQDTIDSNRHTFFGSGASTETLHNLERSSTAVSLTDQQVLDLNLALMFQEKLHDPLFTSLLRQNPDFVARGGENELMRLLQDKGLDPNFAMMLKEKGLDPTILALLQRSSLDAGRDSAENVQNTTVGMKPSRLLPPDEPISWSGDLQRHGWGNWYQSVCFVIKLFVGTPERAWVFFSVIFVVECVVVAVFRPTTVTVINARHEQVRLNRSLNLCRMGGLFL